MANSTSQDNHARGNDTQNDPLSNAPQDNSRNDPQNSSTVSDPPERQNSTSDFEHCFTNSYSFQTSVMSNLNRLDFKHLQLAGVRTPVSQQIQEKYLIPSKCDQELGILKWKEPCPNTTSTVRDIKACYGSHHDGPGWREDQPQKWIEPTLYKHVKGCIRMEPDENEGGHFDVSNVCIDCHEGSRRLHRSYQNFTIPTFHSALCRSHCLEYIEQQPYNACHCEMFIEDSYWRCGDCASGTFHGLQRRALTYGVPYPELALVAEEQIFLEQGWGSDIRHGLKCPHPGLYRPALALWTVRTADVVVPRLHCPFPIPQSTVCSCAHWSEY